MNGIFLGPLNDLTLLVPISKFKRFDVTNRRLKFDVASARLLNDDVVFLEICCNANTEFDVVLFFGRMKAFIAFHLLYPIYSIWSIWLKKGSIKKQNLILIKHLFVNHMERVARMKRQDNKWSTIYLLSSFLVHHKSMKVPKALSNTKSNATIRTPCSHSRSSKATGFSTAHGILQTFFVWYPVNKVSSWKFYAAIQKTETWSPLSFAVISNQTCYYLLLEG